MAQPERPPRPPVKPTPPGKPIRHERMTNDDLSIQINDIAAELRREISALIPSPVYVTSGIADWQFQSIMKELFKMTAKTDALQAELDDLKTTVEKVVTGVGKSLQDALDANKVLSGKVDALNADVALDQAQINDLVAAAGVTDTAIDAAATEIDTLDKSLETVSGEAPVG